MTVDYHEEMNKVINNGFNVRDDLKDKSVEDIRKNQPQNNFAVCAMNLFGDLNVANIIRSSVIFGADRVYLAGRSNYDRRGSVGAQNYIDVVKLNYMKTEMEVDWIKVIEEIKNDGYMPIFIEVGGEDVSDYFKSENYVLDKRYYKKGPCFIFGNEGLGLPSDMLEIYKDEHLIISITQFGVMRSLNVSVAAGIIMYEYTKQF